MDLLEEYCLGERELLMKHDIRLNLIGRLSKLPASTRKAFEELREATKDNRSMVLSLAIDYGGREELVEAAKALGAAIAKGELDPEAIDEQLFAAQLGTADIPDPDLMIRTSGEVRLSNFLLWQAAYTELLFTDVLWPDFDPLQFKDCMDDFGIRQRRFGATPEQIEMNKKMGRTKC
jgi:undecaprenyl diphosphate synthase